jgi:hypothetical protein
MVYLLKMVIFHGYVKSPDGNFSCSTHVTAELAHLMRVASICSCVLLMLGWGWV